MASTPVGQWSPLRLCCFSFFLHDVLSQTTVALELADGSDPLCPFYYLIAVVKGVTHLVLLILQGPADTLAAGWLLA